MPCVFSRMLEDLRRLIKGRLQKHDLGNEKHYTITLYHEVGEKWFSSILSCNR
jgi:hypothetical protein